MNEAKKMAITIPIVSYQSKFWKRNNVLTTKAIIKILIMGSPNVAISLWKNVSFLEATISLLPYFFSTFYYFFIT